MVNKDVFGKRMFLAFLFLINPFLAFCLAVYLLSKQKEALFTTVVIVLFFGLLGYTCLPFSTMDITRHYVMFDKMKQAVSFSDFVFYESLSEKPDFFLDLLYWILGKYVNTHQIVGFLGASIYYGFMVGIIRNWCSALSIKSSKIFLLLLIMFLALIPIYEFSGMRQGNAIMIFLYIITISEMSMLKRGLLLIIPCLLHFSLYPIVALYICACTVKKKKILWIIALCMMSAFFYFTPLMAWLMNICSSMGGMGAGIAEKIDAYLFQGEVDSALYSGSVLRFFIILGLLFFCPIIAYSVNRKIEKGSFFERFHNFFILFFSYIFFSSSSYILSRNLMMFKLLIVLYVVYVLYTFAFKWYLKRLLICLCLIVCISGPFSFILGREYRTLNFSLFTSNIIELLSIKTNPEGYSI